MRDVHGLIINFVSIWNEMDKQLQAGAEPYIKQLRKDLDRRGLHTTKIVACDGHSFKDITDLFKGDPQLVADVDVLGAHYPGTHGPGAAGLRKKAWSSEDYSQVSNGAGPACLARDQPKFCDRQLDGHIAWNLVDSYYAGLPFARKGLMTALHPFSGHYIVDNSIWSYAHTSQFTEVGWMYSPVGQGSGWLKQGGSFVTLMPLPSFLEEAAPPTMTMVIEKMDPTKSHCEWEGVGSNTIPQNENATFKLAGGLATITTLYVWKSRLLSGNGDKVFVSLPAIPVSGGSFSISLEVDCVYTVTTVAHGAKGTFPNIPNITGWTAATRPDGFSDSFDSYNLSTSVYLGVNFVGLTTGPGFFLRVGAIGWATATTIKGIGNNSSGGALPHRILEGMWHRLSPSTLGGLASGSLDGIELFSGVHNAAKKGFCGDGNRRLLLCAV